MSESHSRGPRLDSWKSIAQYLQRDLATVRRWEKTHGLPIRRVGVTGRSVFAYTLEIDDWLNSARPALAGVDPSNAPASIPVNARAFPRRWLILPGAIVAAAVVMSGVRDQSTPGELRIEVTGTELIARAMSGAEQWRYRFPATYDTTRLAQMIHVSEGTRPGVYFATRVEGRAGDRVESGTLSFLDKEGRPQRSISFDDTLIFPDRAYAAPWALTAFAVRESGEKHEVAVAAHHHVWDPSIVTVLDDGWQRRGTYVNAGWIEGIQWLAPDRIVIAGFSNPREGGMIALLDAAALHGQGPEPPGSAHFCENCGTDRPLRMFVFPRTELNRLAAAPFNRAVIETSTTGRLFARTIEMESAAGDADVIYEFTTPSLDFVSARFSDRYWELHRVLEAQGRITHTRDQCPDRDGPSSILAWDSTTGWRTVVTR